MGVDDPRVIMWLLGGNVSLAVGIVSRLMADQRQNRDRLDALGRSIAELAVELGALRRDVQRVEKYRSN